MVYRAFFNLNCQIPGYIGINAYDWLDDESLYVYVSQADELAKFTEFFMNKFLKK